MWKWLNYLRTTKITSETLQSEYVAQTFDSKL